jgi:hypothetical protein
MRKGVLFGRARGTWDVDDRLELEFEAAEALDVVSAMVSIDALVNGQIDEAIAGLPRASGREWVYRGWLINPTEYAALYEAVQDRGDQLAVTPDEFVEAACLPQWAPILGSRTPPSVWTEGTDAHEAWELAVEALGPPPWIVKDHMKSAKEQWHQACFVPADCTFERFAEICEALVDARGDRFEGGLVVRSFVHLREIPYATPAGPAHDEHRLIFWRGRLVASAPYFDADVPPLDTRPYQRLGREIGSKFFTADVARLASGGTTVIEVNDGGCSTLPEQLDPRELYSALFGR